MVQQYPRRLARLKAMADKLEKDYDDAPATVRAQIAAQFRACLADIAALEGPEDEAAVIAAAEEDPVEQAKRARAARRGGTVSPG